MNRREMLATFGSGAVTVLAGCSAISGGNTTPWATPVSADAAFKGQLEGPSTAPIDEAVQFDVTVGNYGSERADFSGRVTVVAGNRDAEKAITVSNLVPMERQTTQVSVSFPYADTYELALQNDDGSSLGTHRLEILPRTATVGQSFDLGDALTGTVRNVAYVDTLFWEGQQRQVFSAGPDSVLAVISVTVENVGTSPVTVRPSLLGVENGSVHGTGDAPYRAITSLDGEPLLGTLQPSQSMTGWVLANVPYSRAVNEGLRVGYQRDAVRTPFEKLWVKGPKSSPQFELVEWSLPESQPLGSNTHRLRVRNSGSADGTFRAVVQWKNYDYQEFKTYWSAERNIPAGKEATIEFPTSWQYLATVSYRLQPFGLTRPVEYTEPKLGLGETLSIPAGTLTVTDIRTTDRVTLTDGLADNIVPNRGKILLARVRRTSSTNGCSTRGYEIVMNFEARGEDGSYPAVVRRVGGDSVTEPGFVNWLWTGSSGCQSGTTVGWVAFDVPSDIAPDDVVVHYSADYDWGRKPRGAKWSTSF